MYFICINICTTGNGHGHAWNNTDYRVSDDDARRVERRRSQHPARMWSICVVEKYRTCENVYNYSIVSM